MFVRTEDGRNIGISLKKDVVFKQWWLDGTINGSVK